MILKNIYYNKGLPPFAKNERIIFLERTIFSVDLLEMMLKGGIITLLEIFLFNGSPFSVQTHSLKLEKWFPLKSERAHSLFCHPT